MPLRILGCPRGPSAFLYRDAEGAPASDGNRYHGALDWFCPGGSMVRSPVAGKVVEVRPSRGNSGQVFGGVVKVQDDGSSSDGVSGRVYVMRHVDPLSALRVGDQVEEGDGLARVTTWIDGPDHVHTEVWRTLGGGYSLGNMIDPGLLDWRDETPPPERDLPYGSTLRLVLGQRAWSGWDEAEGPLRHLTVRPVDPDQDRAAISWRGNVWRGPSDVTNVARSLVRRYLEA